jgi:hypothetical protein
VEPDIRLAPAEHYDNAMAALARARKQPGPFDLIITHQFDAIAEALLGLLRVEMARQEMT